MQGAVDVEPHHPGPVLQRILPGLVVRARDARAGNEDVDAAVPSLDPVAGCLNRGGIGDVDGDAGRSVADLGRGLLREAAIDIPDRDGRAALREALGHRPADPLGTARDDGDTLA